ncbi:MAG: gamma-glutamyl-gamma-aminobutyrate hydrolase family protein [Microbacteriaceae bacterium]|nr:gamma-glutamyl-gamma-aminobutyrate hydrolase family protein [Microbacteriaceae bacterium]
MIGITTYRDSIRADGPVSRGAFIPDAYLDSVARAGGVAVLLPPQPVDAATAAEVLSRVDGVILAGGLDIDPARYGQERHERTDAPRTDRDEWEDAVLAAALEHDVPMLAICRGLQLMNVHFGGTLLQHIPDVLGHAKYSGRGAEFATNDAHVASDSRAGALLGGRDALSVKTYHHQALGELGEGLVPFARNDDGLVYGVEVPDRSFAVGVQWHPEEASEDDGLVAGLVAAARERAAARA